MGTHENMNHSIVSDMNLTDLWTTGAWKHVTETTSQPFVAQTPPPIGFYGDTRELLWKVVTPVIITWGTLGNILTIIVLVKQARKMSSTSMYLLFLAVSDLLLLWCAPFRNWMKITWGIDVRYLSDVTCRLQLYLTYACFHLSSWLLVAVTMERTIGVVSPLKVKLHCTSKKAVVVIASIFIFVFGIDLVLPIITALDGYQPIEGMEPRKCAPSTKEYEIFRDHVWRWIDLSLSFLIPFVFLVVGNVLIIRFLFKSRENQCAMRMTSGNKRANVSKKNRSLVILTIALCVIFFLTMTPVAVFQIYYPYRFKQIQEMFREDPLKAWESYQYLLLQRTIVDLVSYTNASFNFVLYVFSGERFRAELKALLWCSSVNGGRLFTSGKYKTQSTSSIKNLSTVSKSQSIKCSNASKVNGYIFHHGGEKENLVFADDSEISSLSSIFMARKLDHVCSGLTNLSFQQEVGNSSNEKNEQLLGHSPMIFTTRDSRTTYVDRKELSGFYLQL